ncbi:MAG TPA: thiamine pyrophosphate-binding protein [Solirubrobacterales bacterium]|nr:thiamine pyrophosphate-binding protein [Solirubrobacterales bacterium]
MRTSDWIARFLAAQRVEAVYEVAGGMIANFVDALHRDGQVRIVACHHEQGAGFAAEGHARMNGIPGVAMGTSGPGAINLLTALGSCHFDSTPAVFITGQVNRSEQKRDRPIRQLGFQETDVVAMAAPIAKAAIRVETAEAIPKMLTEAFALACAGRPGPVLVDIPLDLQLAEIEEPPPEGPAPIDTVGNPPLSEEAIARVLEDFARAERPLILAGGGLRAGRAVEGFRQLVDRLGVPVVNSLMGVDALPFDHPLRVGMIGTYGNRWANIALSRCDALLVLGSRLDIRQTGADTEAFVTGRTIHHVDVDPGEVNNRITGSQALIAPLSVAIPALAEAAADSPGETYESWSNEIAELTLQWPDTGELPGIEGINPNLLMHQISNEAAAAYVADVGQHQMWAAQSLELSGEQRFLTSGGMGAMGSALPLAVGAAVASSAPVVMIAGDGGFQLNIQELQTVARNEMPVKMVVLDNGCHGMVRQFQESYFDGRYQSTVWGYSAPSFVAVANAYGIPARRVEEPSDVAAAVEEMWATEGPCLLEVAIDLNANAYPKIAFGHPISEMEPFVEPRAMEST